MENPFKSLSIFHKKLNKCFENFIVSKDIHLNIPHMLYVRTSYKIFSSYGFLLEKILQKKILDNKV